MKSISLSVDGWERDWGSQSPSPFQPNSFNEGCRSPASRLIGSFNGGYLKDDSLPSPLSSPQVPVQFRGPPSSLCLCPDRLSFLAGKLPQRKRSGGGGGIAIVCGWFQEEGMDGLTSHSLQTQSGGREENGFLCASVAIKEGAKEREGGRRALQSRLASINI